MPDGTQTAAPAPGEAPAAPAPANGAASVPTVEQALAERDYWKAEAAKAFAVRDAAKAEAKAKASADAPSAAADKGSPAPDAVLAKIEAQAKAYERGLRRGAIEREIGDSLLPKYAASLRRFDDELVDALQVEDGIVRGAKEAVAAFRAKYPEMFVAGAQSPGSAAASGSPAQQINLSDLKPGQLSDLTPEQYRAWKAKRYGGSGGAGAGGFL